MLTSLKTLAVAVIALSSTSLFAAGGTLTLTSNTSTGFSNGSNGGAYSAKILTGSESNAAYVAAVKNVGGNAGSFETFCLEPGETFSSGTTYNYTIDSFASLGGVEAGSNRANSPAGQDEISKGTSYLYSLYALGTLLPGNNTYSANQTDRKAANLLLQKAFWYLEDETVSGYTTAAIAASLNPYLNLIVTTFGSIALGQYDAVAGANGVYALNLTDIASPYTKRQSQLYFAGTPSVPDAGSTALLLLTGLAALVGARKRFAAKS